MINPKLPLTQLFEIALIDLLEKKLNLIHRLSCWSLRAKPYDNAYNFMVGSEESIAPDRDWRPDWKFESIKVIVEIDGGTFKTTVAKKGKFAGKVFVGGRHNIGKGFVNDCEKLNAAAALGYRVYRIANERQINEVIDYLGIEIKNYFASRTATEANNRDHHQDTTAGKRTRLSELCSK